MIKLRERSEVFAFKGNKVLCNLDNPYVVFPGGGIDERETAIEAAKRECQEEAARRLITVTPAHTPTVQIWPKSYADTHEEDGGYTYWFTGSTSDEALEEKHEDYEQGFAWNTIDTVLKQLHGELSGDWKEDVKVRISVLETYQKSKTKISSIFQSSSSILGWRHA